MRFALVLPSASTSSARVKFTALQVRARISLLPCQGKQADDEDRAGVLAALLLDPRVASRLDA